MQEGEGNLSLPDMVSAGLHVLFFLFYFFGWLFYHDLLFLLYVENEAESLLRGGATGSLVVFE